MGGTFGIPSGKGEDGKGTQRRKGECSRQENKDQRIIDNDLQAHRRCQRDRPFHSYERIDSGL